MRLTPLPASTRRFRTRRGLALAGECCENRRVLNAVWAAVAETEPNNTLDISEDLGILMSDLPLGRSGAIGAAPDETADVDWFQFHLEQPSDVTLTARSPLDGTSVQVGLSLFNTSPFTGEDIQTLLGHRLLAQAASDSLSDRVQLAETLAPGTYYVAVSGANNLSFHPFLENSGYAGPSSDYEVEIAATALALSDTDGPVVLSADPDIDSVRSDSPLVVRVQFSHELDPYTISIDDTVRFTYSSNADFGDGDEVSVPLMMQSFSSSASELQLLPVAALKPGYYQIHLAGNLDASSSVLLDFLGQPLGSNAEFPNGRDFDVTFQINGSEGTAADSVIADDTPDGAQELGELTDTGVFQVTGTIGDDPYYDPNVDWLLNPANDVDMYHFQVHGEGSFSLAAEVFAGRIGSPLDPGVSLFQRLEDGALQFVAGNNNTLNPITATNWFAPIFTDAALFAGLTEGDYFVAVSSGQNTPSPAEGQALDAEGLFNPAMSHSGLSGSNTGRYVLNLRVTADNMAPEVVLVSPEAGTVLSQAPTHLSVQFSESMTLQQLAFRAFEQPESGTVVAAFIRSEDGTEFFPRLESYDAASSVARFVLLDRLAGGHYEWHLSGARGLTDLAGHPLVGNQPDGDFVVGFDVESSSRGNDGTALSDTAAEPNDELATAQDLGVVFPHEWQAGITITRHAPAPESAADLADVYRFEVLLRHDYFFGLTGDSLPRTTRLRLLDAEGQPINAAVTAHGTVLKSVLSPGVYFLQAGSWTTEEASGIAYEIHFQQLDVGDNPPPLTGGPAPALQLRLVGTVPLPPTPDALTLLDNNTGGSIGTSSGNSTKTGEASLVPVNFVAPIVDSQGTNSVTVNPNIAEFHSARPIAAPETALPMLGQWLVGGTGNTSFIFTSTQRDERTVRLFLNETERSYFQDIAYIAYLFSSDRVPRSQTAQTSGQAQEETEASRDTDDFELVPETSGNGESPSTSDESTESPPKSKAAANQTDSVEAHEDDETGRSKTFQKAERSSEVESLPVNSSTSSVELFWITGISAVLFGSSAEPDDSNATRLGRRTWPALRAKWARRLAP